MVGRDEYKACAVFRVVDEDGDYRLEGNGGIDTEIDLGVINQFQVMHQ